MADDESEGDPGSSDTRQPATAFGEKETTHARLNLPAQHLELSVVLGRQWLIGKRRISEWHQQGGCAHESKISASISQESFLPK
ncbi:hypothetical protein V9T40_004966 [Parthenolecanium corni]|uniref:Uncharacterized protein n=1 Tax=Parthenolecanium corni TaxID=536013 RepID=A0AAN9THA5_9HEMI